MLFALVQLDVGIMAVVEFIFRRRWQLHFRFRHVDEIVSPKSSGKGRPSTTEQYYNRCGVRTCTLFFFYFRFATHESTDIEWVRYGFPVPDRDRAAPFVSISLGTCQLHTRPSAKSTGIVERERQLRAESHRNDYSPWRAAAVKQFLALG